MPVKYKNIAILLYLLSSTVTAAPFETSKPIICAPIQEILSVFKEDKLVGTFLGKSLTEDSNYALFFNEKEKTWAFIQFNGKNACVLGGGIEGKIQGKAI